MIYIQKQIEKKKKMKWYKIKKTTVGTNEIYVDLENLEQINFNDENYTIFGTTKSGNKKEFEFNDKKEYNTSKKEIKSMLELQILIYN